MHTLFSELVFSQYGSVKRTKVYQDDGGQVKGDGLVTYAKPASVDLAVAKVHTAYMIRSYFELHTVQRVLPEVDAYSGVSPERTRWLFRPPLASTAATRVEGVLTEFSPCRGCDILARCPSTFLPLGS